MICITQRDTEFGSRCLTRLTVDGGRLTVDREAERSVDTVPVVCVHTTMNVRSLSSVNRQPSVIRMTRSEQAVQVWQVLIGAAFLRQTLTYTMLAERIGGDPTVLAVPLGMVNRYCSMKQLPPLAVLVVRSDAGTPADDLSWTTDVDFAREAVYQHEWFKLKPPSANDFALVENMGFGE